MARSMCIWNNGCRRRASPFEEYESEGKLEKIGPLGLEGHEGWYYPDYVEQICPGLPNWTALKGCEGKFATPETAPKGRFLDYAQEWHPDAPQWISLLGLDFTAVNSGGEGSTAAEVKSAMERKAPILVMTWEPTWLVAEYKLKQVQIAPDDPACKKAKETKITLKSMNCDAPPVEIVKFANPQFKEKYPAAYKMLKAFTITNAIQGPLMKSVDVENRRQPTSQRNGSMRTSRFGNLGSMPRCCRILSGTPAIR